MTTLIVSNYLENALINHVFRNTAYTDPASVYIALFTSDPTDADVGTEVSGGSYAREQLTAGFSAPSNGACENSALIEFAQATAVWGLITHIGIYDALSGGNLLFYGALTASQQVDTGDIFKIAAGDLDISLTVSMSYYLANELLDHVLNSANFATLGTSIYVALFTVAPGRDGTGGTEVSGGSYAREQITSWDAPSDGVTQNTSLQEYPVATADWGEIVAAGVYDAATAGNLLFVANLTASKEVFSGDTFQWAVGNCAASIS